MKSSIRKRLMLSTLSMLLLVFVMSLGSIISILRVSKGGDKILRIASHTRIIQDLRLSFEKVLMPPHDYLIYGDPNEIEFFEKKLMDLKNNLDFVSNEIGNDKDRLSYKISGHLSMTRGGIEEIERLASDIFSIQDPLGQGAGQLMKEMDIRTEGVKRDIEGLMKEVTKNRNRRILEPVYKFMISFQNIVMPPHDYLILGDTNERSIYSSIYTNLTERIDKIAELSNSSRETEIINKIRDDFNNVTVLANQILEIEDPLKTEGTKKMKKMDSVSNQVIIELDRLIEYFKAEANRAKERADNTKTVMILFTIFICLFLILTAGIGGIAFSKSITDPVTQLLQATLRISAGDLTHKAEVSTENEIGELAKSFNKMTEELRISQDELIHAKEYIDNIIKSMIDTLIVVNPDGTIHTINEAALKLLNYDSEDKLIGRHIDTILIKAKGLFTGDRLNKLLDEGSIRNYDTIYRTHEGVDIPINLTASVMRDKAGKMLGTVCVARDLREIRKLINDLRQINRDLKSTQAQLIQSSKLASMGVLAAGVAHEINNPMNIIINYAELLEDKFEPRTEEGNYVQGIIREGQRIVTIVNSLLAFARADKQEYSPCRISDIISSSIEFMDAYLAKDFIKVHTSFAPDLQMIMAKSSQLEQVFINLILNARDALNEKYMHPDPKKLIEIDVKNIKKDGIHYIKILFTDYGSGISDDNLDKIFDPFFTTKRVGMGTGLGLSITYGIIADHRGNITVKSQKYKQTTFAIDLPTIEGWSKLEG